MSKNFPDVIFNSPEDRPVLRRIFSYEAAYYDLAEYERVLPGTGEKIWKMVEDERAHQKEMKKFAPVDPAAYGYRLSAVMLRWWRLR